jgi:hypothetical protein
VGIWLAIPLGMCIGPTKNNRSCVLHLYLRFPHFTPRVLHVPHTRHQIREDGAAPLCFGHINQPRSQHIVSDATLIVYAAMQARNRIPSADASTWWPDTCALACHLPVVSRIYLSLPPFWRCINPNPRLLHNTAMLRRLHTTYSMLGWNDHSSTAAPQPVAPPQNESVDPVQPDDELELSDF